MFTNYFYRYKAKRLLIIDFYSETCQFLAVKFELLRFASVYRNSISIFQNATAKRSTQQFIWQFHAKNLLEYPRAEIAQFYACRDNPASTTSVTLPKARSSGLIHPLRLPCIHLERYQSDSVVDIIPPGYNGETFQDACTIRWQGVTRIANRAKGAINFCLERKEGNCWKEASGVALVFIVLQGWR